MELRPIQTFGPYRGSLLAALIMALGGPAYAADEGQSANVEGLRKQLDDQTARLEALKRDLAAQEAKIAKMRKEMGLEEIRGGQAAPRTGTTAAAQPPKKVAQTAESAAAPEGTAESKPREVARIFEQPGVLTPRGKFVLDPSLQYSYSTSNRVSVIGVSVLPALVVGLIDIREVRRNTFNAALTGRYGLTNRLEFEAKLPYVWRSDDVVSRPFISDPQQVAADTRTFNATGSGIGDAEVTARYQLNEGGLNKPYYVGGLRFKSRTGEDPFEIPTALGTNAGQAVRLTGLPSRLPTGTGFYTLQPSLTMLYPSDPAVLFGSVSYQHNFKRSNVIQKGDGTPDIAIGSVEPGGIFGFNVGLGLGLNEHTSMSFGYDHQSVGKTKINGAVPADAVRVQLGSLLIGYSYRTSERQTLNFALGVGVTRDAPDLQLTLRMPTTF